MDEKENQRRRRAYNAVAEEAWRENPQKAMRDYGLPCWHGDYGGCDECDNLKLDGNH